MLKQIFSFYVLCLGVVFILLGCSSSGSANCSQAGANSSNPSLENLIITTPNIIPSLSNTQATAYVNIFNPESTSYNGLTYTITSKIGSGTGIAIDAASANQCSTIGVLSSCQLKLLVPLGTIAGSFGITVSSSLPITATSTIKSLRHQRIYEQGTNELETSLIGIEQVQYNDSVSGANGISLYYSNIVIVGTPYVIVTGIVTSANAGNFNNVVLLDNDNNPLANQFVIGGELGAGQQNLNKGDTFAILLPVAGGSGSSQTIKLSTTEVSSSGISTNQQIASSTTMLQVVSNLGIANTLPHNIYLTTANPQQIITVYNTGDLVSQLISFVTTNPNIDVIFTPSSLSSNAATTVTLKLKDTSLPSQSGGYVFTYNNGNENISQLGELDQNTGNTPITPTAGLNITYTPDNMFYTTTAIHNVSRQLTLTNTGDTTESNFVFNLPNNFSMSVGDSLSCDVSGSTVTSLLIPNQSCNITITYTGSNNTQGSQTTDVMIDYYYDTMTAAQKTTAFSYEVSQSSAILSISPDILQNFGSIYNNNIESSSPITFTISNSGDVSASSLAFNFTGNDGALFESVSSGTCISGAGLNAGESCSLIVVFGPSNSSAGTKNGALSIGYIPYSGESSTSTSSVSLTGTLSQSQTASFSSSIVANTFSGGNGASVTPYQVQESTNGTVSIKYTNTSANQATGFTSSTLTNTSGWTQTTHGCNNVTLVASSGECTDIYTLNSPSSGQIDFNLGANITLSWSDGDGAHSNQTISGVGTIFAYVYPPARIIITTNPAYTGSAPSVQIESINQNNSFSMTATLSGGYNVSAQSVSITNSVTLASSGILVSSESSPCVLSSAGRSSCIFTISIGAATSVAAYSALIGVTGGLSANITMLNFNVIAPTWSYVGESQGFSPGNAAYTSMVFDNNNQAMVAYQDQLNQSKVSVMRFDGSAWLFVGSSVISESAAAYIDLAYNKSINQPYIVFQDFAHAGKASVMHFDGSNWAYVGESGFSESAATWTRIAFNESSNEAYVLYADAAHSNKATVMRYTNNTWSNVGSIGFSESKIYSTNLVFNSLNQVTVAFSDSSTNIAVMSFNGSSWANVGPVFSNASSSEISLAINPLNNQPAVFYTDAALVPVIKQYNGSTWALIGNQSSLASDFAYNITMAFDPISGQPYIVYDDFNFIGMLVKTSSGGAWSSIGNPTVVYSGQPAYPDMVFNPLTNQPYIVFVGEYPAPVRNRATMMKL